MENIPRTSVWCVLFSFFDLLVEKCFNFIWVNKLKIRENLEIKKNILVFWSEYYSDRIYWEKMRKN